MLGPRLGAIALLALMGTCTVLPTESLVTQRRSGFARTREGCGTRRACLTRPRALSEEARELVAAADSVATVPRARWKPRQFDDVAVWIAPGDGVPGWRGADRRMARDAFHLWTDAGAPVHFRFVADSGDADVRLVFRSALPEGRAGQMTRVADREGWLRSATVELSTHDIIGRPQRPSVLRAIALHEVGHLLGLEHSANEHDIMAAWVTGREITARDRTAMAALYAELAADAVQ